MAYSPATTASRCHTVLSPFSHNFKASNIERMHSSRTDCTSTAQHGNMRSQHKQQMRSLVVRPAHNQQLQTHLSAVATLSQKHLEENTELRLTPQKKRNIHCCVQQSGKKKAHKDEDNAITCSCIPSLEFIRTLQLSLTGCTTSKVKTTEVEQECRPGAQRKPTSKQDQQEVTW